LPRRLSIGGGRLGIRDGLVGDGLRLERALLGCSCTILRLLLRLLSLVLALLGHLGLGLNAGDVGVQLPLALRSLSPVGHGLLLVAGVLANEGGVVAGERRHLGQQLLVLDSELARGLVRKVPHAHRRALGGKRVVALGLGLGELGVHRSDLALHLSLEHVGERAQLGLERLDLLLEVTDL